MLSTGTEAQGVANVLMGDAPFHGTLPMPWYASADHIEDDNILFPVGYGLVERKKGEKSWTLSVKKQITGDSLKAAF